VLNGNGTLLEVHGLRVSYGQVDALRDVDITVQTGEVVTVLGANGAGKSSMLGAIAGLIPSAGGRIVFGGTDITGMKPESIAALGLSLVPEGRHIFATLTVSENILLGAPRDAGEARRALEAQYELFPGIEQYRDQPAGTLSGGEQQQLAIARALARNPRLMLLDEPSLGLAPKMVNRVFETLEELRERGTTILLVEQTVRKALQLADRGYVLQRGEVEQSGPSESLLASAEIEAAYLGKAAG
jgi:branched-chain amino acid transport system ATP-binding protein